MARFTYKFWMHIKLIHGCLFLDVYLVVNATSMRKLVIDIFWQQLTTSRTRNMACHAKHSL